MNRTDRRHRRHAGRVIAWHVAAWSLVLVFLLLAGE